MITLTGMIWIPVCLGALLAGFRAQMVVLGASAIFGSAAVVNLGSFGVQPGYFMALLVLGVVVALALPRGEFWLNRAVVVRAIPLAVILLANLNALFWANAVFWDDVWVVSGRQMFDLDSAERYSFRGENFNQLVYLLLNGALVLVLGDRLARLPARELLRTAHAAILAPFLLATLFVIWDWLAGRFGWYFPDAFLHSNAFYAAAHEQSFGDIPRVSGPFSEPSGLAYAYGGFLAYASARYLDDRRAGSLLLVLIAVAALAISTSTTAYALLAVWMLCALVALPVLALSRLSDRSGLLGSARKQGSGGGRNRLAVIALVIAAILGGIWVVSSSSDAIRLVYESSIQGKAETGSYKSRTGADMMGLESFSATWGIGLGLGSHRPSTLPVTLLSNTGLVGTLAFLVFVMLCLYRPQMRGSWPAGTRTLWPVRAFALGLLAAHLVSSPNFNGQLLWLALILNLAISIHAPTVREVQFVPANAIGSTEQTFGRPGKDAGGIDTAISP